MYDIPLLACLLAMFGEQHIYIIVVFVVCKKNIYSFSVVHLKQYIYIDLLYTFYAKYKKKVWWIGKCVRVCMIVSFASQSSFRFHIVSHSWFNFFFLFIFNAKVNWQVFKAKIKVQCTFSLLLLFFRLKDSD